MSSSSSSSSSSSDESDSSLEEQNSLSRNDKSIDQPTKSNRYLGSLSLPTSKCSGSSTELFLNSFSNENNIAQLECDPATKVSDSSTSANQPGSSFDDSQDVDHWDDLDMFDGPVRKPRLPRLTQQNLQEPSSDLAFSVDSKKGKKNVEGRRKSKLDFTRFMFQRVVIKLNGRRQLRGQMQGCDQYNNIVITEGQEKINGKIIKIDHALVRGTSITGIESIAEPVTKEA